jgi:hypothetical protein
MCIFCESKNNLVKLLQGQTKLDVKNCQVIQTVPTNLLLYCVTNLNFENCPRLTTIPKTFFNLQTLNFFNCTKLRSIPTTFPQLNTLKLHNCERVKTIVNFESIHGHATNRNDLQSLAYLQISFCCSIKTLPATMKNLQNLECFNCKLLISIPIVTSQLRVVHCVNCPLLTTIGPKIRDDTRFYFFSCPLLYLDMSWRHGQRISSSLMGKSFAFLIKKKVKQMSKTKKIKRHLPKCILSSLSSTLLSYL